MGNRQPFGLDPILAHKQPACHTLIDFMQPVASRDLRHQQTLHLSIAIQHQLQNGRRA